MKKGAAHSSSKISSTLDVEPNYGRVLISALISRLVNFPLEVLAEVDADAFVITPKNGLGDGLFSPTAGEFAFVV